MSEHDPEGAPARTPLPPILDHDPNAPAPVIVRKRGGTPLLLTLLLVAALGGGIYWTWTHPYEAQEGLSQSDLEQAVDAVKTQLSAQIQATNQQVTALAGRVDALEKQPAAPPQAAQVNPDAVAGLSKKLDDLSSRLDGLSSKQDSQEAEIQKAAETAAQKQAGPAPAAPVATDNTASQVPALIAQQQAADRKIDAGLAAQKTASDQALADQKAAAEKALADQKNATDQALAQQKSALDSLAQRLDKLEQGEGQAQTQDQAQTQAVQQSEAQAKDQLAALDTRVGKLEQSAGQVQGVAQDASRAIRLEAARTALQEGQKLGDIPGAPPALARFANTPPPTESSLREQFPRVAEAARAASQPDLSHRSFFERALARMQQSVTVRRGDHVLVGDPAAGILARAQSQVNAGDLKGATQTLAGLNGPAAAAVKNWLDQASALVDAREALAQMAHS